MGRKVEYSEDIRYGDVVTYSYVNEDFEDVKSNLRVCAKVDPGYIAQVFMMEAFDAYVAVPHEDEEISESIIDLHTPNANNGPVRLEWGRMPKKNAMIVAADSCYPTIDSFDSEHFVKLGRCPRCGDLGSWRKMVCECPWHGYFLG